jgi:GT2 family glycosyltransferase
MNLVGEFLGHERIVKNNTFDVFFVGGNCAIFRRTEFPQPFDSDYFAYAEDNYLCWRAQLRGRRVVAVTNSIAEHLGGGTKRVSGKRFNNTLLMHGTKNHLMNLIIFYEWKNVLRILPLYLITQIGHLVIYLRSPQKIGAKMRAYWWVIRHWPSIMRKRRAIQATRKIPDSDIIVTLSGQYLSEEMINAPNAYRREYRWALRALNRLSLGYCRIVGLRVHEFDRQALKATSSRKSA